MVFVQVTFGRSINRYERVGAVVLLVPWVQVSHRSWQMIMVAQLQEIVSS